MKGQAIKFNLGDILGITFFVMLLVLYIFNIIPPFGPSKIGTREYLSVFAVLYFIFHLRKMPQLYNILLVANWTQIAFSFLSMVINQSSDIWFIQFALRNILYLNGALFIAHIFPKKWDLNFYLILVICAILINNFVATAAFISPSIMNVVVGMQQLDTEVAERTIKFGVRMIGLGCGNYFVGGIINGMGIITSFYLMSQRKLNPFIGGVVVFVLTFIGLFIARTVIVGFAIGFVMFLRKANFSTLFTVILISVLLLFWLFSSDVLSGINTSHAFEIFMSDEGGLTHNRSMNSLGEMYNLRITPETLVCGDGLSKELDGSYYMHTDVGYIRCILYFGLLGTIFGYFYYEYVLLRSLWKLSEDLKKMAYSMAIFLLVLNFKGLPDFNFYIFLIIAYYIERRRTLIKIKNEYPTYYR